MREHRPDVSQRATSRNLFVIVLTANRHTFGRSRVGTRCRRLTLALLAVAMCSELAPTTANAADTRSSRRAVQARRARAAREINALQATDRQVSKALDSLAQQVQSQTADVAAARQAAAVAAARERELRAAEARTRAKVAQTLTAFRSAAVNEYITGQRRGDPGPVRTDSLAELSRRRVFADLAIVTGRQLVDQLRSATEDLEVAGREATAARAIVDARQRQVTAKLNDTARAQRDQLRLAARLQVRLEQRLGEAASLARLDSRLAAELRRSQTRLARRVPFAPSYSGPTRSVRGAKVRTVGGITVATHIATRVGSMLTSARRSGIALGGSGYRNPSQQIATRRRNCGSSSYAVYRKPAGSCRPPTARPGQSMHERATAIDFTTNGRIVSSRTSAYRWLRRNASRYGLRNLPGEPWHWSTNGR